MSSEQTDFEISSAEHGDCIHLKQVPRVLDIK